MQLIWYWIPHATVSITSKVLVHSVAPKHSTGHEIGAKHGSNLLVDQHVDPISRWVYLFHFRTRITSCQGRGGGGVRGTDHRAHHRQLQQQQRQQIQQQQRQLMQTPAVTCQPPPSGHTGLGLIVSADGHLSGGFPALVSGQPLKD